MKVTLKLTLRVDYCPGSEPADALRARLKDAVLYTINRGLLTGDSDAEVENYAIDIQTVPHVGDESPLYAEAGRLCLKSDSLPLLVRHACGDCDDIAWPAYDAEDLRNALYDARETGQIPSESVVVLPDGSTFNIDAASPWEPAKPVTLSMEKVTLTHTDAYGKVRTIFDAEYETADERKLADCTEEVTIYYPDDETECLRLGGFDGRELSGAECDMLYATAVAKSIVWRHPRASKYGHPVCTPNIPELWMGTCTYIGFTPHPFLELATQDTGDDSCDTALVTLLVPPAVASALGVDAAADCRGPIAKVTEAELRAKAKFVGRLPGGAITYWFDGDKRELGYSVDGEGFALSRPWSSDAIDSYEIAPI